MKRYLLYSTLLHLVLLSFLLVSSRSEPARVYYGFSFVGGNSGFGPGRMGLAPAPAAEKEAKAPAAKRKTPSRPPPTKKVTVSKQKSQKTAAETAGGKGISAKGKGDTRAPKDVPVGGTGTSLEIGGFGPGGGDLLSRFPFPWYVRLIYDRLWKSWEVSNPGNQECVVAFTILKNGDVENVALDKSSGDSLYDLMARRAVEASAPFPPLPEGYADPTLRVFVRFKLQ